MERCAAHLHNVWLGRWIVCWSLLLLAGVALIGQQVHVRPRSLAPASTPASVPAAGLADFNSGEYGHPISVNVNEVLVPVLITDSLDRPVTGLDARQFRIFEDKIPQRITSFTVDEAPVSIGILFDLSSSMSDKISRSRQALQQFMRTANPQDEFFLIEFADEPQLVTGFTSDVEQMQDRILLAQPQGRTSLLDAIYLGLAEMRQARYRRKALLIISDGGDNHSRYTEREVRNAVRESNVQLFAIGIYSPLTARYSPEEESGPALLGDLAETSGGREFNVDDVSELPDVAARIAIVLRSQYLLGYTPKNRTRDGKWRKIKVRLDPPPGLPRLTVAARAGYYAPGFPK
jgi:Ca-activated chloride channel family protein